MKNMYNRYNHMHLYRKLDYNAFCVSLSGFLFALLILFFIDCPFCPYWSASHLTLPEVKNYQCEPMIYQITTIDISKDGGFRVDNFMIKDDSLERLAMEIEDSFEEKNKLLTKVLLRADQNTPYEKILQTFQILTKIGIKTVALLTEGQAYPVIEFIAKEKSRRIKTP